MEDTRQQLQEYIDLLVAIPETVSPRWGLMTVQHLLEHLSLVFAISNGKLQAPAPSVEAERLAARKTRFFSSEEPFPRGVKAPGLPTDSLPPLRFPSVDAARIVVQEHAERYWKYWEENPEAETVHPVFGVLNAEEWVQFHLRHFRHHLTQFGALPE